MPNGPLSFTVLAWAYNFTAVKLVYPDIPPNAVAVGRSVLVTLGFLVYCWATKHSLRVSRENLIKLLVNGFVAYGLYMVCFLEGMNHTAPALGAIIMAVTPVLAGLFSMALKQESFRPMAVVGAVFAFGGVVLAEVDKPLAGESTLLGNGLILIGAILWAISLVFIKPVVAEVGPLRTVAIGLPAGLIALLPYGGSAAFHQSWLTLSSATWLNFLHVSLISGGIAFVTYYRGMNKIGVVRGSMYQFWVPPCAVMVAWVLLGHRPGMLFWIGLAVVLIGVWIGSPNFSSRFRPSSGEIEAA
jgi:drug/metabolite transporter (DMT)-like permease